MARAALCEVGTLERQGTSAIVPAWGAATAPTVSSPPPLSAYENQALDAAWRAQEVLDLRRAYHERLHSARSSALLLKLVDDLFDRPATTIPSVAKLLDITYPAARKHVDKLVAAGILAPAPRTTNPKVFVARGILDAVERERGG